MFLLRTPLAGGGFTSVHGANPRLMASGSASIMPER